MFLWENCTRKQRRGSGRGTTQSGSSLIFLVRISCCFGTQQQNRTVTLLQYFFSHRAECKLAPSSHAVRGDNDQVRMLALRDSYQLHADVIPRPKLRAHFYILLCHRSAQILQLFRGLLVEALVILPFLEN